MSLVPMLSVREIGASSAAVNEGGGAGHALNQADTNVQEHIGL